MGMWRFEGWGREFGMVWEREISGHSDGWKIWIFGYGMV